MRKLAILLALTFSGSVFAQTGELWFNYGWNFIGNSGLGTTSAFSGTANDVKLTDDWRFSFRFGFNQGSRFGHEIQYAYNRTHLDVLGVDTGGMAIHNGGYNFLYYFLTDKQRVRPFATGGVGFYNFVPPGGSVSQGSGTTKFGENFGGGVKFHVKGIWAGRFDVRYNDVGKPFDLPLASGRLRMIEVSAGVGVGF
jgi:opacity protein-like surface antigen